MEKDTKEMIVATSWSVNLPFSFCVGGGGRSTVFRSNGDPFYQFFGSSRPNLDDIQSSREHSIFFLDGDSCVILGMARWEETHVWENEVVTLPVQSLVFSLPTRNQICCTFAKRWTLTASFLNPFNNQFFFRRRGKVERLQCKPVPRTQTTIHPL